MNVSSILKAKGQAVTTARPDSSLHDITQRLAAKKIGAIVIVGDNGRIVGIISERDVIRVIAEHGVAGLNMPVAEVMTRGVITCEKSQRVDELMELMTKGRFRHLPVMEEGSLVGIISIGDVVKHHVAEVEMEVSAMRGYLATG
jgi:CBS domain-containing protein